MILFLDYIEKVNVIVAFTTVFSRNNLDVLIETPDPFKIPAKQLDMQCQFTPSGHVIAVG